jgi:hypothetical protein
MAVGKRMDYGKWSEGYVWRETLIQIKDIRQT